MLWPQTPSLSSLETYFLFRYHVTNTPWSAIHWQKYLTYQRQSMIVFDQSQTMYCQCMKRSTFTCDLRLFTTLSYQTECSWKPEHLLLVKVQYKYILLFKTGVFIIIERSNSECVINSKFHDFLPRINSYLGTLTERELLFLLDLYFLPLPRKKDINKQWLDRTKYFSTR